MDWECATSFWKKRIAKKYDFSPRKLIESPQFKFTEFKNRLEKFLDAVSSKKTSYGILEANGNIWLDVFPISICREDQGGLDNIPGFGLNDFLIFLSSLTH